MIEISHSYTIALRRLRDEEGGGFVATIPQLGDGAFNGDGDTPEEALKNLAEIYDWLHSKWTEDGKAEDLFPDPKIEDWP